MTTTIETIKADLETRRDTLWAELERINKAIEDLEPERETVVEKVRAALGNREWTTKDLATALRYKDTGSVSAALNSLWEAGEVTRRPREGARGYFWSRIKG